VADGRRSHFTFVGKVLVGLDQYHGGIGSDELPQDCSVPAPDDEDHAVPSLHRALQVGEDADVAVVPLREQVGPDVAVARADPGECM
jgi:hypothetical protein